MKRRVRVDHRAQLLEGDLGMHRERASVVGEAPRLPQQVAGGLLAATPLEQPDQVMVHLPHRRLRLP